MLGMPYFLRIAAGLLKPKDRRLGADAAGSGRSGRQESNPIPTRRRGSWHLPRGFAEYACASESAVAVKPDNIRFAHAGSTARREAWVRFAVQWARLRPDSRLRREPFVASMQTRLKSEGGLHRSRRTGRQVDDRSSGSFDHRVCVVMALVLGETEPARPGRPSPVHGGRESKTGHSSTGVMARPRSLRLSGIWRRDTPGER